ncbi:MAG: hypothetical protein H6617_05825 [Bdellovibrionaceae bacterium]|nr:hypothetical protein [Bdellovibrionales bacterium]MCB9254184.1 hypothetical protein [Pseudobdellovibrionaceae bacterium]
MGLSWRIGVVVAAASVIFALGLNLALSIILSLATLLILIRREILESLFPLRAYRKNCLSVRGLESDPKFEEQFRNELAAAICQAFPEHKPTACCCIAGGKEIFEATLVLHSPDGHLQIRVSGESISGATSELLGRVQHYNGDPPFQTPSSDLFPRCRGCVTRKAHRLINRNYPYLNPLGQASKWDHFWTRLRTQTH